MNRWWHRYEGLAMGIGVIERASYGSLGCSTNSAVKEGGNEQDIGNES